MKTIKKMTDKKKISFWRILAIIAASFAFVITLLLIVNYVQYKSMNPVETELIHSLVLRLNENPDDSQLRDEIRALDLVSRKAFFTSQWQIRTGAYLLLMSVSVLLIAMQMQLSQAPKEVILDENESPFLAHRKARFWVSILGAGIVLLALFFAFLSHQQLSSQLEKTTQTSAITEISPEQENVTPDEQNDDLQTEITDELEEISNPQSEDSVLPLKDEKSVETKIEPEKSAPNKEINPISITDIAPKKAQSDFPSEAEIKKNFASFRGFGGNGIDFHKNIPTSWDASSGENILWKTEIPLHGFNSPIIWDDKIFLSGASPEKREVYCIDRKSGKMLWQLEVKDIPGSPAKAPKVTDDTGLAAPSLTTDGRRVYAIFANGDLIAIDMSGKQVWAKNLGPTNNHYGHSSSLMLFEDVLLVQYDIKTAPKLFGLSSKTGEEIFSTPRKVKISWASPVLVNTGNRSEVILSADPIVASYNPKTGAENWQLDCIFGEVGPSVTYADGIVYAVNEYAKLVAIKLGESPEILWENDEYLSDAPSPVAANGLLFVATSYGAVACYDAKNGEKYWENEFSNGFYSSPMFVEGKIYLMDMSGVVHIFKADKEFVSIGECPIGEDGMTTPAFMDGRVYIRGNEHLFCVGK